MRITVVVPVGPFEGNRRWLGDCIASVCAQERMPDELLLIDDMAALVPGDLYLPRMRGKTRIWRAPWRLGVAGAFNAGVSLAEGDGVFMLGSDDLMEPFCLADCEAAWEREIAEGRDPREGYFWVPIHYMDEREDPDQFVPCGTAMVSHGLWKRCGGFPPETAIGAPDVALLSILLTHEKAGRIVTVSHDRTLVNYRAHWESESGTRPPSWQGPIIETRGLLTDGWAPPAWGRFTP